MTAPSPSPAPPARTWRDWGPWVVALLAAALSLWLHMALPVEAKGDNWWDERWFLEVAGNLVRGHWLGEFGPQTLSKGPFYPLFIAASFLLGLPLRLAEQMFYLACAGLLSMVAARLAGRWLAAGLFVVLACNPVPWMGVQRVLRENIYGAEALLLFALATRLYLLEAGAPLGRPLQGRIGGPLALGAAFAAYWLTREEGIWLLPSLGLMLLFWLGGRVAAWRRTAEPPRRWLLGELRYLALPLLVFLAATTAVEALNWHYYGVWRLNDFARSSSFVHAYGALTRIKTAQPNPRYLFTAEARAKAYAVSPAARELQPLIEGEMGKGWIASTCDWTDPADPLRCKELISGWLPWMLRDIVNSLGYRNDARRVEAYYQRLAEEIDGACDSGRLECLPPRATLAPPLPPGGEWLGRMMERLGDAYRVLSRFGDGPFQPNQSSGQPFNLRVFQDLTGGSLAPVVGPGQGMFVRGRVLHAGGAAELTLARRNGDLSMKRPLYRSTEISPEPIAGNGAVNFFMTGTLDPAAAKLVLRLPGQAPVDLPLRPDLTPGTVLLDTPQALLTVDEIGSLQDAGQWTSRQLQRIKIIVIDHVTVAYARLMPKVTRLALVVFLWRLGLELWRRRLSAATVLAAALLGAALGRVALLAFIDATSFHVMEVHYMAPAHPLLLAFCGLVLAAALPALPWRLRLRGDGGGGHAA